MEFQAKIHYTVDFSQVTYYSGLYDAIMKGLELPDYVGKNLDALWDCLTGFVEWPCEITITGLLSLSQSLLPQLQDILTVFKQAERTYPENIHIILEDESFLKKKFEYTIDLAVANDNVWKIMKEDNHLHQAVIHGLGIPWCENNTKNIKEAIWDYLTGHGEGWPTVITIKNISMMGENYQAEWADIFMGMKKAANQYPEQIKIIVED